MLNGAYGRQLLRIGEILDVLDILPNNLASRLVILELTSRFGDGIEDISVEFIGDCWNLFGEADGPDKKSVLDSAHDALEHMAAHEFGADRDILGVANLNVDFYILMVEYQVFFFFVFCSLFKCFFFVVHGGRCCASGSRRSWICIDDISSDDAMYCYSWTESC